MKKKIRIIHLINSLEYGGAEAMLCNLLLRSDLDRFNPSVVTLIDDMAVAAPIIKAGFEVATMGMKPAFPSPLAMARLAKYLRRAQPDIVQTWMDHSNFLGGLTARLFSRARVVWGIHHSNHVRGIAKRTTLMTVAASARVSHWVPARIVSCSMHASRLYAEMGFDRARMTVIPNGFDTHAFHPDPAARRDIRNQLGIDANAMVVGLIARYDPQKDHLNFLRAAAVLAKKYPSARFLLCGDKVDGANSVLVSAIASLGLQSRCVLTGARRDMPTIYASIDILASSSVSEAFPLVIGEAMSCGVPCVVTDVGDSALIVSQTGRVVPPKDSPALAAALGDLIEMDHDARTALGLEARARVRELFDLGAVTRRYEALYENLLTDAPSGAQADHTVQSDAHFSIPLG